MSLAQPLAHLQREIRYTIFSTFLNEAKTTLIF